MKYFIFLLIIISITDCSKLENKNLALDKNKENNQAYQKSQSTVQEKSNLKQDELFLGEDGPGKGLQGRAMHKILFGVDKSTKYSYDVEYAQKFLSYFPIRNQTDQDSPLNELGFKYIFLYDDHISIFNDKNQDDPLKQLSQEKQKVGQKEFLNNYPLDTFLYPCDGNLCFVHEFKKYYDKLNPESPYKINELALKALGPDVETKCFLLIQDLLIPQEYFYVCSDRLDHLLHMKFAIEEASGHVLMAEEASQVSYILPSGREIVKAWMHVDKDQIVLNNMEDIVSDAKIKEGYFEFFKYSLHTQIFTPGAEPVSLRRGNDIFWKGDQLMKPNKDRCMQLNAKFKDESDDSIYLGHEYICFFSTATGDRPVDLNSARIIVDQWAMKINKSVKSAVYYTTKAYLTTCTEPECLATLKCRYPVLAPIMELIYNNAVKIENICKVLEEEDLMDGDECRERKKKDIVYNIEESCSQLDSCENIMADCVKKGQLPLREEFHKNAWGPYNLYRNLDATATVIPEPMDDEASATPAQIANYNREQMAQYKIQQELGTVAQPPPAFGYKRRPSIIKIQTALATFRTINQGKQHKSMFGMLSSCIIKDAQKGTGRQISLVPFIARFDPQIEFLGYMADTQNITE